MTRCKKDESHNTSYGKTVPNDTVALASKNLSTPAEYSAGYIWCSFLIIMPNTWMKDHEEVSTAITIMLVSLWTLHPGRHQQYLHLQSMYSGGMRVLVNCFHNSRKVEQQRVAALQLCSMYTLPHANWQCIKQQGELRLVWQAQTTDLQWGSEDRLEKIHLCVVCMRACVCVCMCRTSRIFLILYINSFIQHSWYATAT